jgi:hypothetical protein
MPLSFPAVPDLMPDATLGIRASTTVCDLRSSVARINRCVNRKNFEKAQNICYVSEKRLKSPSFQELLR